MRIALQFSEAAEIVRELADDGGDVTNAYVTLCVHAGIAAADVRCAAALGEYAHGENHVEAVALLAKVDRSAAKHLDALLKLKTVAGYGTTTISADRVRRATRAMEALVESARVA
ncbi:MAG: hypothetical protein H5T82_03125 [Demequina sp.]|nr:hypothetical protein [Demequina sp.]